MRLWDHFEKMRNDAPEVPPVEKAGARISAKDLSRIQDMHDTVSDLCGGAHCKSNANGDNDQPGRKPGPGGEADMLGPATQKRGARHSAATMECMKTIHDACCDMGAKCDA